MFLGLLIAIHVLAAALLVLVILMQAAKGGGLSGAFGTGMGSSPLFGAATSTVLVRTTTVLAVIFAITCLSIAWVQANRAKKSSLLEQRKKGTGQVSTETMGKEGTAGTPEEGAVEEKGKEGALSPVEAGEAEKAKPGAETQQPPVKEEKPAASAEGQGAKAAPQQPQAVPPPESKSEQKEAKPEPSPGKESLSPVQGENPPEKK